MILKKGSRKGQQDWIAPRPISWPPTDVFHIMSLTLFLQECDDVSDEKNCKIVSIDPEKYLKSKPPPSIEENSKLPISLRYDNVILCHLFSYSHVHECWFWLNQIMPFLYSATSTLFWYFLWSGSLYPPKCWYVEISDYNIFCPSRWFPDLVYFFSI